MNITKLTIGGWFQRTTLQLSEIYDFLRDGESKIDLNKEKLLELRKNLDITALDYDIEGLELLRITTADNIMIKIFEDGLIILSSDNSKEFALFTDIEVLASYYETKLSPALSYIFSLGAPVPKELANIQTVYPYFIILNNATKEDFDNLLAKTEKQKYFEFHNPNFDVLRGDKYYFINNKGKDTYEIDRYVEEQIFMREFKGQLHRYLNMHRIIWEKIDNVKENVKIKGKDIINLSTKIEGYEKTVNLIEGRINQMGTYLKTREKLAKSDENLKESLELIGYRYETLGNTLTYIQHLWKMTLNYVKSARSLFDGLNQEITSKSVNNLTIVTSMGVGASIIGLFTESAPEFTTFGIIYFFVLAVVGFGVNKIMKLISRNRKYQISDIEYDKNIK